MLNRLICLLLLFLLLAAYAFVTEDNVKVIALKLDKFRKTYPQEKVHLHTDKPYYSIGDTIYFKAYVVNAEKNLPSAISNILYVDMIDDSSHISQTLQFPLTDGVTWGTIDIPDSLREGAYSIRAYTNWMRNFDDAYFFNKVIAIGNGFNSDLVANSAVKLNSAGDGRDSLVITYNSLRNISMESKEVSYGVIINKKEINKAKAITGSEGNIAISLASLHLQDNQPAELHTRIRIDDKTVILKPVKFRVPVKQHTLQFFPEGGQMVAGLPARVGFKAVDADGLGIDVSGQITDDSSSVSIPFKSGFAGIGSFQFTPLAGHSYYALLKYKDGGEAKVVLPKAAEAGYVLAIDNTSADKIAVNIISKEPAPADKVILVAQSNNRIQYAAPLALSDGSTSIAMSKKMFGSGIVQFTLFDAAMQPVAERLAFINRNDYLKISMALDKTSYSSREHAQMVLDVKDEKGNPVNGTFSVAVTDAGTVSSDKTKEGSILADLLLTSDIKGYIESPDYYFSAINDKKIKALDDLLLTQGWRRFFWKDILAGKYPATIFSAEKSLSVSGKVLSQKGEPVAGSKVTLLSKEGAGFVLDTLTDANGNFTFDELSFDDSKPFVVQASGKGVQVKLMESVPPAADNKNMPGVQYTSVNDLLPYLRQSRRQYEEKRKNGLLQDKKFTLKEVTVKTKQLTKIQEAVAPSANLNGPGNADQILTYADLDNCSDLTRCLPGKALGVIIRPYQDPLTKYISRQAFSTRGMTNRPMMVVLDGIEMGTGQFSLTSINPRDIQSIEILRSGGYLNVYGTRGSEGILVITTKRGNIDYNDLDEVKKQISELKGTAFTTAKGYSVSRQFYVPDYSNPISYNASTPDLRSTIFWQPDVVTDDDGKATIEFYNADSGGDYNVVIEGMSADGKIGHAAFTYKIK